MARVEGFPVVGDLSFVVVERHRNRLKDALSLAVDKGELNELRAIDVVVVGQVEVVVCASQILASASH